MKSVDRGNNDVVFVLSVHVAVVSLQTFLQRLLVRQVGLATSFSMVVTRLEKDTDFLITISLVLVRFIEGGVSATFVLVVVSAHEDFIAGTEGKYCGIPCFPFLSLFLSCKNCISM